MRPIDADALFTVIRKHHDLYKGATNPADKARRDECLQVMCDINDAPTIDAIPMEWLNERHRKCCEDVDTDLMDAITVLCNEYHVWQKEQEAR